MMSIELYTSGSLTLYQFHFLDIALGSAYELETQLIIAKRRKYISKELFETTDESIMSLQKRIGSFIATIIGER